MLDATIGSLGWWVIQTPLCLAYTGPGAGLTMLGSLIAVLCVVMLALVAPVIYLIRCCLLLLRRPEADGPGFPMPTPPVSAHTAAEPAVASVKDIVQ